MAKLDYGNIKTDEMLNSLERRLKKEYKASADEVEELLTEYLEEFEEADSEKLEEVKQGKITEQEYKKWRTGLIAVGLGWRKVRDKAAKMMSETNDVSCTHINNYLPDVFAFNMNYGTYEVEMAVKLDTGFNMYNKKAVEQLQKSNKDLLPKASLRHAKDIQYNRKQFQSHMMQGLLRGESIPKIAKRLPRAVGETNLNGAIRRARTMTTGVENSGRLEAYHRAEDLGIQGEKMWMATIDGRTRHTHAMMDGETVGVDDTFSNGLEYAGDPSGADEEVYNCRCRTQYVLKDFERDASDLTSRYSDIDDMSYDEWQEEHRRKYEEEQERKRVKNG